MKIPARASCTFKGWFTDPASTHPVTDPDSPVYENTRIYEKWAVGISERCFTHDLGLGKRYVIYQVGDTHVNAGTSDFDLQRERARLEQSRIAYAERFNEVYDSNLICKESKQRLCDLLGYVNGEKPDAVCYCGDMMDCYSAENFAFIKSQVEKTNAPFVYATGNHEAPAACYADMPGVATTEFSVLESDGFEIVCLDNSQGFYTGNQYALLSAETGKAKPIIIVQHVPIVTSYNKDSKLGDCGGYYYIKEGSSKINDNVITLLCTDRHIGLILCGHIHGTTDTEIADGKRQLTCSSGLMGNLNRIVLT